MSSTPQAPLHGGKAANLPGVIEMLTLPLAQGAQQFLFQAGKGLVYMDISGIIQTTGPVFDATEIDRLLAPYLPEDKRAALATQPGIQYQMQLGNLGFFDIKMAREGNALKAILKPVVRDGVKAGEPEARPAEAPAKPAASPASVDASAKAGPHEIDRYFGVQLEMGASDMHLSTNVVPMVRKDGTMMNMTGFSAALQTRDTERILWELMPEKNREEFRHRHDTDFAYEYSEDARFRCNIFMDRKGMGAVFRVIPAKILTAESLGLSQAILKLCYLTKGLVLVTGPTGSGKSTTLSAMVDYINRNRSDHIITIEDPVEFVHPNKKCLINQREVHSHTSSFKDALRAALREDPDIILVGEMRDLETIAIAIETAETGHLVFGTLHTSTAPSTVDRIIDQFPADRQSQIRIMLSESLKGVIAQTLCKKIGGGRIAAIEVLICDGAIANLIREAKTTQIPSSMQIGKAKGNVTLNDSLIDLVKKKLVEPAEAYLKAVDKVNFESMLKRENIPVTWGNEAQVKT